MDELGFTKIAAAVLATALGVMIIRTLPEILTHTDYPAQPAYRVGPIEVAATGDAEPLPFPQPEWVAAMDATRGAKVFKKCQSCHNTDEGGANGTGPNLWNVVGAKPGANGGFAYSAPMAGMETNWTYEALDGFLTKPAKYLSGTKMAFVGLKKAEDRAAVIEYLRIASNAPIDPPVAVSMETAEEVVEMVDDAIGMAEGAAAEETQTEGGEN